MDNTMDYKTISRLRLGEFFQFFCGLNSIEKQNVVDKAPNWLKNTLKEATDSDNVRFVI